MGDLKNKAGRINLKWRNASLVHKNNFYCPRATLTPGRAVFLLENQVFLQAFSHAAFLKKLLPLPLQPP